MSVQVYPRFTEGISGIVIFTVPDTGIKVFAQGKTIVYDYGCNTFEHKKEEDPKFYAGTMFGKQPLRYQ